jgi:hypothetical protein
MRPIWKFVFGISFVCLISSCSEEEEIVGEDAGEIVEESIDDGTVEEAIDPDRKPVDADQIGEE